MLQEKYFSIFMCRELTYSLVNLFLFFVFMSGLLSCSPQPVPDLTDEDFLSKHIEFLASEEMQGRLAGSIYEAKASNYISDQFLLYGLIPTGDDETYLQQFILSGPMAEMLGAENTISRNVTGSIPGSRYPERVIVIGAHYDGQGTGGAISMDHDGEPYIHPSADDNASGTAGLLYLARYFSMYRPDLTVQLAAFSGEEMGLLGSSYFVAHMDGLKDNIIAMINLDMIGRLSEGNLNLFGTGSANIWNDLLDEIEQDSLPINRVETGAGSSDHVPFYYAGIPVLHYFTGNHEDYHRPSDTPDKIDIQGLITVLNHVKIVIEKLAELEPDQIEFTGKRNPQPGIMSGDRVTLGVMPDYSFSGEGFRIDGVRDGQPAGLAGLMPGDIIFNMGGVVISDIYTYMEALNKFETGQQIVIRVNRDGKELDFTITF